ncbi:MAG TPA: polysaccharide biosynthesis/export family protein [Candidatus Acidoferrum sp.]|nr:polysaccharide biosynthesis/export family protein [Candidatus Acidoferrum sp.]
MQARLHLTVVLALAATAAPALAQKAAEKSSMTTAKDPAQKTAPQDPNYVIGAQDVLDINVWKEADLTRIVPVRPDGKISLPLLNDVQAAGLTPTQLADEITTDLKKFVTDPQVTVIVSEINSQRVYIMGEVLRAGAYPLLPDMTMLQALSSAGGFTQFANLKKIYMFRTENGKQVKYPFNYKEVISGKRPDQNVVLKAGDTIVVP